MLGFAELLIMKDSIFLAISNLSADSWSRTTKFQGSVILWLGAHIPISIIFSTRNEPYEGVNETINYQQDNINAKIDDFRSIKIWKDNKVIKKNYFPKNNGHKEGVLQPFSNDKIRLWKEIKASTELMLFIEKMVQNLEEKGIFVFK